MIMNAEETQLKKYSWKAEENKRFGIDTKMF
jgi:hypothetical protein